MRHQNCLKMDREIKMDPDYDETEDMNLHGWREKQTRQMLSQIDKNVGKMGRLSDRRLDRLVE